MIKGFQDNDQKMAKLVAELKGKVEKIVQVMVKVTYLRYLLDAYFPY